MKMLMWNLLLMATWTALTRLSPGNLLLGFLLGYLALWLSPGLSGRTSYFRKMAQVLRFSGFFSKELIVAAIRVAHDVLTPTLYMRPAVVGIPLDARTDTEIAMLAIVITLTPGTLALDISSDRKTLYVHAMYVSDPELLRHELKAGFERRVLELLR